MTDEGFVYFIIGAVVVLALIVVFGVLSSRKKARAVSLESAPTLAWVAGEPVLSTGTVEMADKRQGELFRAAHPLGSALTVSVEGPSGPEARELHVSRHGMELRAGWPQAKKAYTAYFEEFEGAGLPASGAVSGERKVVRLLLEPQGVTGFDRDGGVSFSAPWTDLKVSVGDDLILAGGGQVLHLKADGWPLEHFAGKYGTFKQMHF